MRKLLALACCGLCLAFGSVADLAHVHESADHHAESRGVHVDHGHLGEEHGHHHGEGHPLAERHADHHEGDAVYLNVTAARRVDASVRVVPAMLVVGTVVDPPVVVSNNSDAFATRPRDPPRKFPPRLRAPPA